MKKLLTVTILLGLLLTTWLPGCEGPEDIMPVDSTDYLRVAEIYREMGYEQEAEEFLATADPRLIFLIEDTVELTGFTQVLINDSLIFEDSNETLAGLGQNYAYALRPDHGDCGVVSGMTARLANFMGEQFTVTMSAPARTAGGRGANDFLTVQSTWTNTFGSAVYLDHNNLYIGTKRIAYQSGGWTQIPAGDTLQVTWTVSISSVTCPYTVAERNNMAQGINPEAAWGGSVYTLNQAQWVFAVGNSGLLPPVTYWGGDGSVLDLLIEFRYISDGAHTVNEFEIYNSNSVLATEQTGYNIPIVANDIMRGYHKVTFKTGGAG